ncbi:MAG: hypothetical protein ACE5H5_04320 [Nitrospinota bacterium]
MPGNSSCPRKGSLLKRCRRLNPYQQAALVYLLYGLLYLAGAAYLAAIGRVMRGSPVVWFALGSLFVLLFPVLIWRGFKWVTRLLSILLALRVVGLVKVLVTSSPTWVPLPGGLHLPQRVGVFLFLLVAMVACAATARAGWGRPKATPVGSSSPPPA